MEQSGDSNAKGSTAFHLDMDPRAPSNLSLSFLEPLDDMLSPPSFSLADFAAVHGEFGAQEKLANMQFGGFHAVPADRQAPSKAQPVNAAGGLHNHLGVPSPSTTFPSMGKPSPSAAKPKPPSRSRERNRE